MNNAQLSEVSLTAGGCTARSSRTDRSLRLPLPYRNHEVREAKGR